MGERDSGRSLVFEEMVRRRAMQKPKVAGSNPAPATTGATLPFSSPSTCWIIWAILFPE
jgi:hypothetical protein